MDNLQKDTMKSALKPILIIANLFFSVLYSSTAFGLGNYYNKFHPKPDGTAGGRFPCGRRSVGLQQS
jgi:hypothetical protein